MEESAPLDARPERGDKKVSVMDVSNVSSIPSSDTGRPDYEKGVSKKKHRMKAIRKFLSRDLKPTIEEDSDADDDFDKEKLKKKEKEEKAWLSHSLSLRRPSGKKGRGAFDVTGGGSQPKKVGTGSTRKQLPDHVLKDEFEIPAFDCSKLDKMKEVGQGSQAIVYSTSHDGVTMALKVLRPELTANPIEHETFEREVNLLARLAHPNINSVIGIGLYQSMPSAILEWCPSDITRAFRLAEIESDSGAKLRQQIKLKYPAAKRLKFVLELASAMAFLHSGHALPKCFVLHRDLKPSNLGLSEENSLKLLDFGLACCLSSDDSQVEAMLGPNAPNSNDLGPGLDTTVVRRGKAYHAVYDLTVATGSPRYMANEVGLGRRYGLKADIYSFAIVAWEILVLARPFGGLSPGDLERRVWGMGLRPTCPRKWHPEISALFTSMWHADPDLRPPFDAIVYSFEKFANMFSDTSDPLGEHLDSKGTCC